MPDKKISELPVASALTGYESIPVVQTGNTVRTTLDTVSEYVSGNVRPYKVYTALLTQSGGDDPLSIDSGLLTIGVTYMINNPSINSDFTNVGAPNNLSGTYFIATGTTPNNWGTDTNILTFNTGAPVVTVLENTIGNIWFTYSSTGVYNINSNSLFTIDKTIVDCTINGDTNYEKNLWAVWNGNGSSSVDNIRLYTWNSTIPGPEDYFNGKLEIRVYN